jgi:hypothetical protein
MTVVQSTSNARKSQRGQAGLGGMGAAVIAVLLASLVVVQGVSAWSSWQREASPLVASIPAGALCSVQLLNGQVYYGTLAGADSRQLTLRDVYYVQTAVAPATNQPSNRLVNRRKVDWHAPTLTTFPADKVLMVESVGPESRLAKLVLEDGGDKP